MLTSTNSPVKSGSKVILLIREFFITGPRGISSATISKDLTYPMVPFTSGISSSFINSQLLRKQITLSPGHGISVTNPFDWRTILLTILRVAFLPQITWSAHATIPRLKSFLSTTRTYSSLMYGISFPSRISIDK